MGHQIIKQPDGKLAVFSSFTDTWIMVDASPEEIADYYANEAAEHSRRATEQSLEAVLAGEPQQVYYQFAMTFEEADWASRMHDGPRWSAGAWENLQEVTGS